LAGFKFPLPARDFLWTGGYTLILLLAQIFWVSQLPFAAMRIDLLLPLIFGVAVEWPAAVSIGWACAWGFVGDTLSGKFWGFHVGSYVATVCLVNMTAERFELQNPVYSMFFVGLCALAQSVALGLYLLLETSDLGSVLAVSASLLFRSLFTLLIAPLVTFPLWSLKGDLL
jgi:rod shape-determining protein MreD